MTAIELGDKFIAQQTCQRFEISVFWYNYRCFRQIFKNDFFKPLILADFIFVFFRQLPVWINQIYFFLLTKPTDFRIVFKYR